jgi:2-aminophenol/2-amino-5-chlorophenol 1,6-dioxygenase alpha subunit
MTIVAAFLFPGLPHPMVKPEVAPWGRLAEAAMAAAQSLDAHTPDTLVIYSTQWIAVLDQLWQTRPHLAGLHVDENWHDWADLPFDIAIDAEFAASCIAGSAEIGVRSRPVDYDQFPIDTGTIVTQHFLNAEGKRPLVVTSNNVYHDWALTERLGGLVRDVAEKQKKKVAVIGVGGLSARMYRTPIDPHEDGFADPADDAANRLILDLLARGDVDGIRAESARIAGERPVDSGLKHLAFLVGALNGHFAGAKLYAYEPVYGTGAAIAELLI